MKILINILTSMTFFAVLLAPYNYAISAENNLSARCGFASRSELLAAAQDVLQRFEKIPFVNYGISKKSMLETDSTELPQDLRSTIVNITSEDSRSPYLAEANANKAFEISFAARAECQSLPCADSSNFKISLPALWLTKMKSQMSEEKFELAASYIIAHEMGHLIYSPIFRTDSTYPRVAIAGPLTPLKYHLTVDAIGITLINGSIDKMVEILSETMKTVGSEGDGQQRIDCLEGLK